MLFVFEPDLDSDLENDVSLSSLDCMKYVNPARPKALAEISKLLKSSAVMQATLYFRETDRCLNDVMSRYN